MSHDVGDKDRGVSSPVGSDLSSEEHLDLVLGDLDELAKEKLCVDLERPNSSVKTLRLNDGDLSARCLAALIAALSSKTSHLRELHLNGIRFPEDSGVQLLFNATGSERCKLKTLRLTQCGLKAETLTSLVFTFESDFSHLKEFDLSLNHLQDSGVNWLCVALKNQFIALKKLNLVDCGLTKQGCASLASIFECGKSHLKELDLSVNHLRESGMKSLCNGLKNPFCTLETLKLMHCKLTKHSCAALASAITSQPSHLKVLDLTGNHLTDSGVRVLCAGLKHPHCAIDNLKLVHCDLSKTSCSYLASVLMSEPSHLHELDLSFNSLQDEGIASLSAGLSSPKCGLNKLWLSYCDFSDVGCAAMLRALKTPFLYPILLDIRGNELSSEGMTLLERATSRSDSAAHFLSVKHDGLKEGGDLPSAIRQNTTVELLPTKFPDEGETHAGAALPGLESKRAGDSPQEEPASPSSTLSSPPPSPDDDAQITQDSIQGQTCSGWSATDECVLRFEPKILHEQGRTSYRFRGLGPGVFLCTLTGLGFKMICEGELLYKTIPWDEDLLKAAGKHPAGPLFKIEGATDAVSQLHLLHSEQNPAELSHALAAVHMSDEGLSILEPLEINNTHIVVDVSQFSGFGVVIDFLRGILNIQRPISSQVLLFHRPTWKDNSQKVNVFLLPKNIPLEEVKQQQEDADYIEATSSCHLCKDHSYTLQCTEAKLVQPSHALFDLNYGPNYHPTFEMRLSPSTTEATVTIHNQEAQSVWQYHVDLSLKAGVKSASSSASLSVLPAARKPAVAQNADRRYRQGGDSALQDLRVSLQFSSEKEKRLFSVRKGFIDRASISVVNGLLDVFLQRDVINYNEKDHIQSKRQERDKAEALIDMMLKKGELACNIMIDALCKLDPFVSATLKLTRKDVARV